MSTVSEGELLQMADDSEVDQIQKITRKRTREEIEDEKEMAKIVAPCIWKVDRIYKEKKGQNARQDVTAAVMEVIAAHGIPRLVALRRYKAALNHCINAVPTRKTESRMKAYQPEPRGRSLACINLLPTTEYDYKIIRASRCFRINVATLNAMLIEIEQKLSKKPPVLVPIPAAEGGDEPDGEPNEESRARKESSNDLEEGDEESAEPPEAAADEAEDEKEEHPLMKIARRLEAEKAAKAKEEQEKKGRAPERAAAADGREELSEENWPIPFDEPIPFTGDMMDETKSREERFRSFVDQLFYHIDCPIEREALDWMVKCMVDPKYYGEVPNIVVRDKIRTYYDAMLPSIHVSDFWPVPVRFNDYVKPRVMKIKATKSIFDPSYSAYGGEDEQEKHPLMKVWRRMEAEKAAKAKEEQEKRERKRKEEMERAEREHKEKSEKKERKKAKQQAKTLARADKAKARKQRQREKERNQSAALIDGNMDSEEGQLQREFEAIGLEGKRAEFIEDDIDHEEILGMEEAERDSDDTSDEYYSGNDDEISKSTSYYSVQQGRDASDVSAVLMTDSDHGSSEAGREWMMRPVKVEVKEEPLDEMEEQENMDTTLVGPPPEGSLDGPRGLPLEENLSMYTREKRASKGRKEEEAVMGTRAAADDDGAMPKRGRTRGRSRLATPSASKKTKSEASSDDEDEEEPRLVLRRSPRGHSLPLIAPANSSKKRGRKGKEFEEEEEQVAVTRKNPRGLKKKVKTEPEEEEEREELVSKPSQKKVKEEVVEEEEEEEKTIQLATGSTRGRRSLNTPKPSANRKRAINDGDEEEEATTSRPRKSTRTASLPPSTVGEKKKKKKLEEMKK